MAITRYSPWNLPANAPNDLRELIEKFFHADNQDQSNVVTSQWAPHVDIKEEPNRFVIQADIPGVDPNAIEIHMEKGILSIKGERKTNIKLTFTEGVAEGQFWTSDLNVNYVRFNADYTT